MKLINKEQYVLQVTIEEYSYDTIEEMIYHERDMHENGYEVSNRMSMVHEYKKVIKQSV